MVSLDLKNRIIEQKEDEQLEVITQTRLLLPLTDTKVMLHQNVNKFKQGQEISDLDGENKVGGDELKTNSHIQIRVEGDDEVEDEEVEEIDLMEKVVPNFPWLPMGSICIGMLAHSVVFTNPLPYVAFMVVDFKMADSVDSAGYYAGWITGTFMIGRTMAGLMWGIASDRYGRKMCLLLSMMNVAIFGLLLGFSTSFTMAVSLRLAIGLGNGFMGVAKTCVSEICAKEHELRAFGMINGMWGLGLIVGPAVGGLLSRPAIQYPAIISPSSIWGVNPYLLPCFVCALIAVVAFFCILVWLPETAGRNFKAKIVETAVKKSIGKENKLPAYPSGTFLPMSKNDLKGHFTIIGEDDEEEDIEGDLELGAINNKKSDNITESNLDDIDAIVDEKVQAKMKTKNNAIYSLISKDEDNITSDTKKNNSDKPQNFNEMLKNKNIQFISVLYTFYCFSVMFIDESFPLWAVTSMQKGGLSWTSGQVGAALASVGLMLIVFQFFCYESLIKNCCTRGPGITFFRLVSVSSVSIFLLPIVAELVTENYIGEYRNVNNSVYNGTSINGFNNTETNNIIYSNYSRQNLSDKTSASMQESIPKNKIAPWIIFLTVVLGLTFYRVSATSAFTTLGIVTNDSVDKELRGTLNGFMMTCGSLGNALGPILGSTLYAFSTDLPKPFDGRIVFILGAFILITPAIFAKKYLRN